MLERNDIEKFCFHLSLFFSDFLRFIFLHFDLVINDETLMSKCLAVIMDALYPHIGLVRVSFYCMCSESQHMRIVQRLLHALHVL